MNQNSLTGIAILMGTLMCILIFGLIYQSTASPHTDVPTASHSVFDQPVPTEKQVDLLGEICVGTAGFLLVVGGGVGLVSLTRRKEVL